MWNFKVVWSEIKSHLRRTTLSFGLLPKYVRIAGFSFFKIVLKHCKDFTRPVWTCVDFDLYGCKFCSRDAGSFMSKICHTPFQKGLQGWQVVDLDRFTFSLASNLLRSESTVIFTVLPFQQRESGLRRMANFPGSSSLCYLHHRCEKLCFLD